MGSTLSTVGETSPAPENPIETVADLIATLNRLSDRQRRGFGYWVDPKAFLEVRPRSRRLSRQFREAARAFDRLGDDTLTKEERASLRRATADEACWYDGSRVVGRIADVIEENDQAGLRQLAPAIEWLRRAAETGADRIPIEIPPRELGPGEEPEQEAPRPAPMNEFERQFHGPLWGYRGAALFGAVCTIPFISKPNLATPLASFGPPLAAFVVGFIWLLAIMTLIHWLGMQTEWTLVRKRRVLIAAFLAAPVVGLVVARIVGG